MEQRSPAGPLIGARDTGRDGTRVGGMEFVVQRTKDGPPAEMGRCGSTSVRAQCRRGEQGGFNDRNVF